MSYPDYKNGVAGAEFEGRSNERDVTKLRVQFAEGPPCTSSSSLATAHLTGSVLTRTDASRRWPQLSNSKAAKQSASCVGRLAESAAFSL